MKSYRTWQYTFQCDSWTAARTRRYPETSWWTRSRISSGVQLQMESSCISGREYRSTTRTIAWEMTRFWTLAARTSSASRKSTGTCTWERRTPSVTTCSKSFDIRTWTREYRCHCTRSLFQLHRAHSCQCRGCTGRQRYGFRLELPNANRTCIFVAWRPWLSADLNSFFLISPAFVGGTLENLDPWNPSLKFSSSWVSLTSTCLSYFATYVPICHRIFDHPRRYSLTWFSLSRLLCLCNVPRLARTSRTEGPVIIVH